ncbi:MAG: hypothetical protein DWQ34_10415 [Planctomycetota bacterium]|nr:MAG: hypothetical protein DWQ34_10415 [Planctomycetota bacterium]
MTVGAFTGLCCIAPYFIAALADAAAGMDYESFAIAAMYSAFVSVAVGALVGLVMHVRFGNRGSSN